MLLAIEVAKSSLDFDLNDKARSYSRHEIQDYWVLDLSGERVIVHRHPPQEGYRSVVELRRGESIAPLAFPDAMLTIDELLGEPE